MLAAFLTAFLATFLAAFFATVFFAAFLAIFFVAFLAVFFATAAFFRSAAASSFSRFFASFSPASKRLRMSAMIAALSLLRWLAVPLAPRLLPVRAREASFCRRTRSRLRSRALRARVMRVSSWDAVKPRSALCLLSS